jgi:hypothetical protein
MMTMTLIYDDNNLAMHSCLQVTQNPVERRLVGLMMSKAKTNNCISRAYEEWGMDESKYTPLRREMARHSHELSFRILPHDHVRMIVAWMFLADISFVVLYLAGPQVPMFDLNRDGNLPTMYSVAQLLLVAVFAYFYGMLMYLRDRMVGIVVLLGAALFLYLAFDEGAKFHEAISNQLYKLLIGPRPPGPQKSGMWEIFLGPPLLIALIGGAAWLRRRLTIQPAVFLKALVGAVVFVSGAVSDIMTNFLPAGTLRYQTSVEEGAEMIGVTLILWAVMTLLAQQEAVVTRARNGP